MQFAEALRKQSERTTDIELRLHNIEQAFVNLAKGFEELAVLQNDNAISAKLRIDNLVEKFCELIERINKLESIFRDLSEPNPAPSEIKRGRKRTIKPN